MAQKDLIPMNKRTKEEVKQMTSNGGKKSGEVRREKRDLKQCFEIGLEFLTKKTSDELKSAGDDKQAEIVAKIGVAAYSMLKIAVSKRANEQTKLNAWEAICDRMEGKPISKSVIDANVKTETTVLTEEEKQIIERQIKKEADKLTNSKK
jgi:hypothetical protein